MSQSTGTSRGFTLIELVMSLFIIGLVTGAVVWTLPGEKTAAHEEASRFAARLNVAIDESVLSGESVGVAGGVQSYAFYRYRRGNWILIDDIDQLRPRTLSQRVQFSSGANAFQELSSERDRADVLNIPSLVFSPIGAPPNFSISITDGIAQASVSSSRLGQIEVTYVSAS